MVTALSDEELVNMAKMGDLQAFTSLVTRFSNAVFATALHVSHDFHYAEDIAQETFIRAWRNISQLKDGEKFGGWIYTIAKRLSLDWARKNQTALISYIDEMIEIPVQQNTVEDMIIQMERKRTVWHTLNQLDENHRSIIILYYISGFSSRQISRYLDISINTVESRIRRAKQKMKKELSELVEETLVAKKLDETFSEKVKTYLSAMNTIYIPVSDFWRSKEWYENILGLEWGGFSFKLDSGPSLMLCETKDQQTPKLNFTTKDGYEMFVVTFQTRNNDQFLEFYNHLKQQGVEVEEIEDRGLCGKNFRFYDPDRNKMDVWNGEYLHETDPQWVKP